MAKHTFPLVIGANWTAISEGEATVLVQRRQIYPVELFVAEAGTPPVSGDAGHTLAGDSGSASFTDLNGLVVFARAQGGDSEISVTRY